VNPHISCVIDYAYMKLNEVGNKRESIKWGAWICLENVEELTMESTFIRQCVKYSVFRNVALQY